MRSLLRLRYAGGILFTGAGYTTLKINASEKQETKVSKVRNQIGEWRRWKEESESLGPFLKGIGAPAIATFFVDAILIKNDLSIQLKEDNTLEVTDKTLLGSNITKVVLGAEEVERLTRGGRKKFMLSAFETDDNGIDRITVQCRLFQRGPGWYTQQSWIVDKDDILREEMVLKRAEDCDIIVKRSYKRLSHHNADCETIDSSEEHPSSDNGKWTKTIISLAGLGTICLITWFLGPIKRPSSNGDTS